MAAEVDDHTIWVLAGASPATSLGELVQRLQALEDYLRESIPSFEVVDRDSAIRFQGAEVERSLVRSMRHAVQSQDARRIRRVLRLVAHRSHWKPFGAHTLVTPIYTFFSDRGLTLGDIPRSSSAYRLSILGGCVLASMCVGGVPTAFIALAMGEWTIGAVLAIVAVAGWAGMRLYRSTTPRYFPRRFRESRGLDTLRAYRP